MLTFDLCSLQVGLLDLELNRLTKALFLAQVVLSVVMVALHGFVGPWYRNLFRFVVLFSYIIPIRCVFMKTAFKLFTDRAERWVSGPQRAEPFFHLFPACESTWTWGSRRTAG